MNKVFYFTILGVILSQTSQAADSNSHCAHFHLQISNQTTETCFLTGQKVLHGNLISSPPLSIIPGDSKFFDMEQTIYGPEILLTYRCGSETISMISKQNLCLWEAGNISGTVLSPLPRDLNAAYKALNGSYFWEKPGNINWDFFKNH